MIDISMTGGLELQKSLNRLADKESQRIAKKVVRRQAKVLKNRIVQNAAGLNPNRTDESIKNSRFLNALRGMSIKQQAAKRGLIRIGPVLPSREELGIPKDTPKRKYGYYPLAIEWGYTRVVKRGLFSGKSVVVPARPYMRSTIDQHADMDLARMGKEFGKAIEKAASRG